MDSVLTFLGLVIAIGAILFLSYVFSKYVGQKFVGYGNSDNMKVVDRIAVDRDKSLAIIEVGSRYYLISIGSSDIHMLQEVSAEDIKNMEALGKKNNDDMIPQFKNVFLEVVSKIKR